MAKFDAILFDVDGTIVDNMDAHLQAWVWWAKVDK